MSSAALLAILCGAFSGFALGLVGAGGSILGTPMLLYVVGVGSPHRAIGTAAVAISISSVLNLASHAFAGNVRWRAAIVFAAFGVAGALAGSTLGKAFDGQKLLFLFGLLMCVVAIAMLRKSDAKGDATRPESHADAMVAGLALVTGMASGFFGVGGGFLIVPCLLFATQMPMIDAVGSSLLAVAAFSTATAANYAHSGLVDWPITAWFVIGGVTGGLAGMSCAIKLCERKSTLRKLFGGLILGVAVYVIVRSLMAILL